MVAKLPEEEHPRLAFGWAARDQSGVLSPFKFSRRFFSFLPFLHTFIFLSFFFPEIRKLILSCVCVCAEKQGKKMCASKFFIVGCVTLIFTWLRMNGALLLTLLSLGTYLHIYVTFVINLLIDRFFNINVYLIELHFHLFMCTGMRLYEW